MLAEPHSVTRVCCIPNGQKHHFPTLLCRKNTDRSYTQM